MTKRDDVVISDAEVARRVASGELVRAPKFGAPPTRPNVMRALRKQVGEWKPHKVKKEGT